MQHDELRPPESRDHGPLCPPGTDAGMAGIHPGASQAHGQGVPRTVGGLAVRGGRPDRSILSRIKGRCRVDDITGCWIWTGSLISGKYPQVSITMPTLPGNQKMQGRRAVWIALGRAIPTGWRVVSTCPERERLCLNPAHIDCMDPDGVGRLFAERGTHRTLAMRIAARQVGQKRAKVTPEEIAAILEDERSYSQIAEGQAYSRGVVARVKTGQLVCFEPVGGLFTGLMGAAS